MFLSTDQCANAEKRVSEHVLTCMAAVAVGYVEYVVGALFTGGPLIVVIFNYLANQIQLSRRPGSSPQALV